MSNLHAHTHTHGRTRAHTHTHTPAHTYTRAYCMRTRMHTHTRTPTHKKRHAHDTYSSRVHASGGFIKSNIFFDEKPSEASVSIPAARPLHYTHYTVRRRFVTRDEAELRETRD